MSEAQERQATALKALLEKYQNVAAAKADLSPFYEEYHEAQQARHNLRNAMNEVQYAAEVGEYVESDALYNPRSRYKYCRERR